MSKAIKGMMIREYRSRFDGLEEALVISLRGVKAIPGTRLRKGLRSKGIRLTLVRNALARQAMKGGALEKLEKVLTGSSAVLTSQGSVVEAARELIALIKDIPEVELKGAILDGTLFEGKAGVTELSKFPTKGEAIGQAVTLIVSPGRNLLAQVQGPGSRVAGIIKSIEEKLEKGEAIKAIA